MVARRRVSRGCSHSRPGCGCDQRLVARQRAERCGDRDVDRRRVRTRRAVIEHRPGCMGERRDSLLGDDRRRVESLGDRVVIRWAHGDRLAPSPHGGRGYGRGAVGGAGGERSHGLLCEQGRARECVSPAAVGVAECRHSRARDRRGGQRPLALRLGRRPHAGLRLEPLVGLGYVVPRSGQRPRNTADQHRRRICHGQLRWPARELFGDPAVSMEICDAAHRRRRDGAAAGRSHLCVVVAVTDRTVWQRPCRRHRRTPSGRSVLGQTCARRWRI